MTERADVIICWYHGEVRPEWLRWFSRPTRILALPNPARWGDDVRSMNWPHPLRKLVDSSAFKWNRVAIVGFSASCQGVRAFLDSADFGYVDTVACIDGITAQTGSTGIVRGAFLGPYVAFGQLAAFGPPPGSSMPMGTKQIVITNSQADGSPGYDPTSLTTKEIFLKATEGVPYAAQDLPAAVFDDPARHPWTNPGGTIQWPSGGATTYPTTVYLRPEMDWSARVGGMSALSYRKRDPTSIGDHRYQAAVVLPMVIEHFIARRWNSLEPRPGVCTVVA
jgi:hypothetical protein